MLLKNNKLVSHQQHAFFCFSFNTAGSIIPDFLLMAKVILRFIEFFI